MTKILTANRDNKLIGVQCSKCNKFTGYLPKKYIHKKNDYLCLNCYCKGAQNENN